MERKGRENLSLYTARAIEYILMSMSGSFEEKRVEVMTISFEQQLSIVYPIGPHIFHFAFAGTKGNDDKKDSGESHEALLFRNTLQTMVDELTYPSDFDGFKKTLTTVVHKWKAKNSQKDNNAKSQGGDKMMTQVLLSTTGSTKNLTSTGKPTSLFDQLQGGFALPISLEEIQEAPSNQRRLDVFRRINYLEDLLMDWNKISPILTDDLSESFLVNPNLSLQLINLHRKWFDQGRSSSEYTPLLYGICGNLIRTLAKIISLEESQVMHNISESNQKTVVVSLVQGWRDMWLDLMQRDQYSEDLAEEMEKYMFELFLGPGCGKMSLIAQTGLASIDPTAAWFQSWTNHILTNDHLISLLRGSQSDSKVLPELWTKVRTFQDIGGKKINYGVFQLYSVAILSIMLCRTRLAQFPWDALTSSNSPEDLEIIKGSKDRMNNFRTSTDEMLDFFLRVVAYISLDDNNNNESSNNDLKMIVLNGIEAILAGSHSDTDSEIDRRYRKVKSSLQEQS